MAGIYIHVPYCKVRCHYCDFHFSTNTKQANNLLFAMLTELENRKNFVSNEVIETIYFGGGTPSFMPAEFIDALLEKIRSLFQIASDAEITIECNPDDITIERLVSYKRAGINRFSMGLQSFDNDVLKFMNRAHAASDVFNAIDLAKSHEFKNITVDLIYGIPQKDLAYWKNQLAQFEKMDLPHLSSYCLTIEPKTVFGKLHKNGTLTTPDDELTLAQFQYLMDFARDHAYEHYEISNFAQQGFISRHNSNYWLGKKYLGIGPSAHSYNLIERNWNISNNSEYIRLVSIGESYNERELLTAENRCNDYLLTRLRTKWGISLGDLSFLKPEQNNMIQKKLEQLIRQKLIVFNDPFYILSDSGKYRADGIASELFL